MAVKVIDGDQIQNTLIQRNLINGRLVSMRGKRVKRLRRLAKRLVENGITPEGMNDRQVYRNLKAFYGSKTTLRLR